MQGGVERASPAFPILERCNEWFLSRTQGDIRRYTQGYAAIRAHIAVSAQIELGSVQSQGDLASCSSSPELGGNGSIDSAVEALAPFLGFFVAAARISAVAVGKVAQDGGASWPAVAEGVGGALKLLGELVLGLAARVNRF
jgi:hypothetical protein